MRPQQLNPLFASLDSLAGVGPKSASRLEKLITDSKSSCVLDLLFHLPHAIIDRRNQPGVKNGKVGEIITAKVQIDEHIVPPRQANRPYKVLAHDDTGEITLVFFRPRPNWLSTVLPIGETRIISGRFEVYNEMAQMTHPDLIATEQELESLSLIEPVYRMTSGLTAKQLRKAISSALEQLPELPEWLDPELCKQEQFPSFGESLRNIHTPNELSDLETKSLNRRRLAYDESLACQLALVIGRFYLAKSGGTSRITKGDLKQKILASLPFKLTQSQEKAILEIEQDLVSEARMQRLIQGDVGSGKTILALLAMSHAVESGSQAALMAPTEILVRQHFASISEICEKVNIKVAQLTGQDSHKYRREIEEAIETGEIDIVIGTHALFQAGIKFNDLGLAVIDEQHRFGVHQRLALRSKGENTDLLVMTATPIPRTLVLTYFGDMDVSMLTEKPGGENLIMTNSIPLRRLDEVIARIKYAVQDGQKVYWVCPLVEESEKIDISATEDRFKKLKQEFGDQVAMIHGRMSGEDKEEAMRQFSAGGVKVLVATTVIEVGVDVPDATIMVIEHAERFGLSQLHQLRGRVGRRNKSSFCLLLFKSPLSETAQNRIAIMRETNDGFKIAEEDLRNRGEGEILGTRQSGTHDFRVANLSQHKSLMEIAHDDARLILKSDPSLRSERGEALKMLLHLFHKDQTLRLLDAG